MSALALAVSNPPRARHDDADIAAVVLGTGLVGGALLRLLDETAGRRRGLRLVGVANSRHSLFDKDGLAPPVIERLELAAGCDLDAVAAVLLACDAPVRVVIDATPAAAVAQRHARWLAQGIHVVTANKIAQGGRLQDWHELQRARRHGGAQYGDSATVGAGLPALASLRRLGRTGDRLVALDGVLSGSLSFLFNRYDGTQPFSALLQEARERGYTEPDPRADLSGADVARKLLILARAAGVELDEAAVEVEGLVPAHLARLDSVEFQARLGEIDAVVDTHFRTAQAQGKVLRYLASLDTDGRARVGLRAVDADHPCAALRGADNLFAFTTERYRERPLVVVGPGAGADVTAQGLLADALDIAG
ncbi:MAG TPA: homoserine dehydrogenase [Tahibacter sp.]|uniref:homoserine dehydrogenase n=1 Tax=Tahibacter sp. TaxID=2056211 RepID=UPI002BB242F9|nr:homoserine dehydrogenase [Tahibacter sp.]HSX62014.1 homoserine dehydrogenase [Tahibacter sp.]